MASSDIMLYWGSGSPPCWRVMIVLHEKGITNYNQKLLSFEKKEHKSEEVLKLNPRGQLPTLKIGDVVINESAASCEYLERVYSKQGHKLIPDDPAQLASVLQKMHEVFAFQMKVPAELIPYLRRTKPEDRDQELLKTKKQGAVEELMRWENYMQQKGDGSYLATKDFSMADALFFPILGLLVRMGLQLGNRLPRLSAYYEMVKKRPSVQATWPPHWKGTENMRLLADLV